MLHSEAQRRILGAARDRRNGMPAETQVTGGSVSQSFRTVQSFFRKRAAPAIPVPPVGRPQGGCIGRILQGNLGLVRKVVVTPLKPKIYFVCKHPYSDMCYDEVHWSVQFEPRSDASHRLAQGSQNDCAKPALYRTQVLKVQVFVGATCEPSFEGNGSDCLSHESRNRPFLTDRHQ